MVPRCLQIYQEASTSYHTTHVGGLATATDTRGFHGPACWGIFILLYHCYNNTLRSLRLYDVLKTSLTFSITITFWSNYAKKPRCFQVIWSSLTRKSLMTIPLKGEPLHECFTVITRKRKSRLRSSDYTRKQYLRPKRYALRVSLE